MESLRFSYLLECAEMMRRSNERFREACWDQQHEAARIHFEAMRAIGKDIETTLREIEKARKQPARKAA
jgi:hypothetical protein